MQLTSWLGLDLNYRYDHVKYLPSYDKNIPVPNGLITGLFKKFSSKEYVYGSKYSIPPGYENCTYDTPCYKKKILKTILPCYYAKLTINIILTI